MMSATKLTKLAEAKFASARVTPEAAFLRGTPDRRPLQPFDALLQFEPAGSGVVPPLVEQLPEPHTPRVRSPTCHVKELFSFVILDCHGHSLQKCCKALACISRICSSNRCKVSMSRKSYRTKPTQQLVTAIDVITTLVAAQAAKRKQA